MIAVGLWAALKGGRALWLWPVTFVGVMLIGGALGMAHVAVPFVEPGILASVVALGLLVALAVDLPLAGWRRDHRRVRDLPRSRPRLEVAESIGGIEYMAGFAVATATLHLIGIGFAQLMTRNALRPLIRVAGAVCIVIGAGLIGGVI